MKIALLLVRFTGQPASAMLVAGQILARHLLEPIALVDAPIPGALVPLWLVTWLAAASGHQGSLTHREGL